MVRPNTAPARGTKGSGKSAADALWQVSKAETSACGTSRTCRMSRAMSAHGLKPDQWTRSDPGPPMTQSGNERKDHRGNNFCMQSRRKNRKSQRSVEAVYLHQAFIIASVTSAQA